MKAIIVSALAVLAASSVHAKARLSNKSACLDGLAPLLTKGNFSGSTDCVHDQLTVKGVGQVQAGPHIWKVYDYHYVLAPACSDCAGHGGQRVIFLRDGRYFGQYKPEAVRVSMSGHQLVLAPTDQSEPKYSAPVGVRITEAGPPVTVWVGGEVLALFQ